MQKVKTKRRGVAEDRIALSLVHLGSSRIRESFSSIGGSQGFTLIEVLIAITVFAIGILAVAMMQSHSTATNATAMTISRATTIASEQIEQLKGLDYTNSYLDAGGHDPGVDAGLPPDPDGFDVQWVVNDNTPMDEVKQIVVTVQSTAGPATTTTLTYYKVRTY